MYRWKKALEAKAGVLLDTDALEQVLELPYGIGEEGAYDHPEGMTLFAEEGEKSKLLVVYDSPHWGRIEGESGVQADLFRSSAEREVDSFQFPVKQSFVRSTRRASAPARVPAHSFSLAGGKKGADAASFLLP